MMKAKEKAIKRIAIFMEDRVSYATATGDRKHTTVEAIEELLMHEMNGVPDGQEVPSG
jgi:hypothetical protein